VLKFTKEGTITVTCEIEQKDDCSKEVIVRVTDIGSGINGEIFPKLFSKFTSKSFQGAGLGLFISKNIIEGQSGKIWAENNDEGKKGTTVAFSLPFKMINSSIGDSHGTKGK